MSQRRQITRDDIMPLAEYGAIRREQRRKMAGIKRLRRVEVGPYATFYFENYDTMWHQVHEMLFVEKGGEAQIADELNAYNPLIPDGDELIATVMFEIEDPRRRESTLHVLGGIENHMLLKIGDETIRAKPDPTRENTSAEGKASSVQFVWFPLSPPQKAAFRAGSDAVSIGFDHPRYGHMATLQPETRVALAGDLVA